MKILSNEKITKNRIFFLHTFQNNTHLLGQIFFLSLLEGGARVSMSLAQGQENYYYSNIQLNLPRNKNYFFLNVNNNSRIVISRKNILF